MKHIQIPFFLHNTLPGKQNIIVSSTGHSLSRSWGEWHIHLGEDSQNYIWPDDSIQVYDGVSAGGMAPSEFVLGIFSTIVTDVLNVQVDVPGSAANVFAPPHAPSITIIFAGTLKVARKYCFAQK